MQVGYNGKTILNNINQNKEAQSNSIKKISSGKEEEHIDPAMAMLASAMMSDILTDTQGVKNANIASAMMQIANATLSQVGDMGTKLQELSVASNNAALSPSDKNALNTEFKAILKSINSSISSTTFNGQEFFGKDMTFSLGSSEITINLQDISTSKLDINSQDSIKDFMKQLTSAMSQVGSTQNAINVSVDNLTNQMVQKSASKSQMNDIDIADELNKYNSSNIKLEASLLVQSHQNEISTQRISTLLD